MFPLKLGKSEVLPWPPLSPEFGQSPRPVPGGAIPFLGLDLHLASIIVGRYGNANPLGHFF